MKSHEYAVQILSTIAYPEIPVLTLSPPHSVELLTVNPKLNIFQRCCSRNSLSPSTAGQCAIEAIEGVQVQENLLDHLENRTLNGTESPAKSASIVRP